MQLILKGSYIQDFKFTSTATINLQAEIVLQEADLNLCSLTFVNADGFQCNSFDFCPITKTCLLNSGNMAISNNIPNANVTTDSCSHYKSKILEIIFRF